MRTPTPPQLEVLNNGARIRVVRALPGSGKTWLVAELIHRELADWRASGGGVAALSFTRVGGEEIRRALGHEPAHPHFVGTLDAFLFRYVVRPYLQRVFPNYAAPRLIPADWSPGHWTKGPGGAAWEHRGPGADGKIYKLFEICFVGEDAAGPILARRPPFQGAIERIVGADRAGVMTAKQAVWQRFGWLTHADAAFLACQILGHATHGAAVRKLLVRRFPFVIVDELQDTGFYLGEAVRLLLDVPEVRGVMVGDPDQAIYEFNGASPHLFGKFETITGATALALPTSLRCPSSVTACASHLKQTGGQIGPAAGDPGRAILVRYANMVQDVQRLVHAVRECRAGTLMKVIARQTKTTEELTSRGARDAKSLHCPALHHVLRAVRCFRQGLNAKALANARSALELAVFGHEGVSEEQLEAHGISASEWKALAVQCLLKCTGLSTATNLFDWQTAAATIIDNEVSAFGLPGTLTFVVGRLRPQRRTDWQTIASEFLPSSNDRVVALAGVPVQTVHGVKGETHDITVLVCPSATPLRCPSTVWWSDDPAHHEERRIAYVAMTRSRGDLIVCVSGPCHQRLVAQRADFVGTFQSMTVDQCIAAYSVQQVGQAIAN